MMQEFTDLEIIDSFLKNSHFAEIAEKDIGTIQEIIVDWQEGKILFYGAKGSKSLDLDETLTTLKKFLNMQQKH